MKALYLKLRNLCSSIEGIKWVDRDFGQLENYADKPPVAFPCVLIKMTFPSVETIADKEQLCTGSVSVRVATNPMMQETSSRAPQQAVDRTLEYDDYAEAVFNKLQNNVDGVVTNFDRISFGDETRSDGLLVYRQTFSCTVYAAGTDG